MRISRRNLLCLLFVLYNALAFGQENVFHREFAGVNNWWDNANPWFYQTSNNNQNRADNLNSGTTKHNVFIGHNNNTAMNINGTFFGLRSLNFDPTATVARTFGGNNIDEGLGFTSGIFNNSSATHTFNARIAADADIIINAASGGLVFNREIFSNTFTITFRGPQNINATDVISQTGSIVKELGGTLTLSGANTYTGTTTINGGMVRLNRTGGGTLPSANDITINSGGTLQVSTNQTLDILTVNAGSTLQVDANTTLTVTGAFTGGGTITNNGRIVLAGTAAQSFPGAGTVTAMNELEINNAANINLNNSLAITGSLILTTGTLNIQAGYLLDLNGASLVRTSGFLNGSNSSDFTVRGNTGGTVTIPQSGNISLRTVTISDNRIVAMNGVNNLALSGAFTIASTATFDNGGESQITQNTGGAININGKFITRDADGFTGSNAAIPGITPTLNTGCTIEYGRLGNQLVNARSDYKNISFSGSGSKTLSSACDPAGTVYITGSAILEILNHSFGDANTNLTMDGGRFRLAGTGTKPDMRGTYNLTGGVIEFFGGTSATNQTIRGSASIFYHAIEINSAYVANSNANINLSAGGSFTIKSGAVFTINDESITGLSGNQTVTIESGAKFVCGDDDGFSGGTGATSTSIRSDVENINLNTGSTVEYSRATAQVFSTRTDYKSVIISGGGEKTLNGAVTMSGILTLISGLLNTTSTNLLTMDATATCPAGGNNSSFINGPIAKNGNSDFVFPVGKKVGSEYHYRSIGISGLSASLSFTAEFRRENATNRGPVTAPGPPPLVRVSACEYWTLDRAESSGNANVTLTWSAQSPCNTASYVTELSTLVVAHFNGTSWDNYGGLGAATGSTTSGTITWSGVSIFSPFSLGTVSVKENILPLTLSSFTAKARKIDVQIDWHIMNNNDQDEYIIERSNNGVRFELLKKVEAKIILDQAAYTELDQKPFNGWNYYRLRVIDKAGEAKVSNVVKVWFGINEQLRISPNPASEKVVINLSEPSSISVIELVNISGQVLRTVTNIQFSTEINISQMQAGIYYLRILGKNGLVVKSFVKN